MRLEYYVVKTGAVLDTVTVGAGSELRYDNGIARAVVEGVRRRGGLDALPSWTNGYVALRVTG